MAIFTPKLCVGGFSSLAVFFFVYVRVFSCWLATEREREEEWATKRKQDDYKLMLTKEMSVYNARGRDYFG